MTDDVKKEEPLWTLAEQKKMAGKSFNGTSRTNAHFVKPKFMRNEERIKKLEAELDLVHDREKIAHMEQTLIERGLMAIVDRKSTLQFVKTATFEKERKQKETYYQFWQKALRENEALQQRLDEALGVKQKPADERW